MPSQEGSGGLFRKYGDRLNENLQKAVEKPTEYGPIGLPPGVRDGRAQVVKCYFKQYETGDNQGEYYFRCEAVALEPATVLNPKTGKDEKVAGLRTSIMIPCCETKNKQQKITTQEENMAKVINEMKKIAGDEYMTGASMETLEELAKGIQDADPPIYIKFRTSQGAATPDYPDPKVWENWDGSRGLEDYVPPDNAAELVQDATKESDNVASDTPPPARPKTPPTPAKTAPKAAQPPAKAPPAASKAPPTKPGAAKAPPPKKPPEPAAPAFDEFADLDSLRQMAERGDLPAIQKLTEHAISAGFTQEQVDEASSWQELVDLINGGGSETANDDETVADEFTPEVGQVYAYKPPKAKTPVDCEVMEVDVEARTMKLKNLTNQKVIYPSVSFDDLET